MTKRWEGRKRENPLVATLEKMRIITSSRGVYMCTQVYYVARSYRARGGGIERARSVINETLVKKREKCMCVWREEIRW